MLFRSFDTIYHVTSFFLSLENDQIEVIEKRLEVYIETLQEYATLIFIAPTPVFPTGPESCVLLEKHCTINKAEDLQRRQPVYDLLKTFERRYEKVFVYDAYEEICPGTECVIYDHKADTLTFMDQDHLSVEESVKLSTHFDAWLSKTFDLSVSQ